MGGRTLILLDTHVLVWLMEGDAQLGESSRSALEAEAGEDALAVSAISFWEISMLLEKERIQLALPSNNWRIKVLGLGIEECPINGEVGIVAAQLSSFHGDLADRLIVATALLRSASLMTADQRILGWSGRLRCLDARL